MVDLILIRGLPGSGKSTLARKFVAMGYAWFEADRYFETSDGEYRFDGTRLREAHNVCQQQARDALRRGANVVVSNTFSRQWEMQPYRDMASNLGARLTIVICEGNYGNVHSVPEAAITAMRERWEASNDQA